MSRTDPLTTNLKKILLYATAFGLAFSASIVHASELFEVTVERGVTAKMRDGVVLRADIYRPKAEGKFPVLLQRTPYNKSNGVIFGVRAAARGFVVIFQDVRGRYSSEGEWYTFKHESDDGYDSVEWAAALPYSNGKVGMFGGSYVGATQMLAAIAHPPHLAGICPVVTASNYHDGWTYQGGAFEQWFNESWTSGLAQDTFDRTVSQNTNALQGMWKLPLTNYPLFNFADSSAGLYLTHELAPYFLDWLAHPNYDDYWKRWSIEEHYADINVPALTVAAWYDIFQGGSLRNYTGIRAHGGVGARSGQRLLVVIGGHAGDGRKIGDVDFGPAAAQFEEDAVTLNWYEYLLKGIQNNFAKEKPVKVFVMGRNEWREEDDWPLARAQNDQVFSAFGWKRKFSSREWQPFGCAPGFGIAGSLCVRSRESRPDYWRSSVLRQWALAAGAAGSTAGGSPRRCPDLLHSSFCPRLGNHRTGQPGILRKVYCCGYRFHRQAGRCGAGWFRAEPDGRNYPRVLSRIPGKAHADEPRTGLQVHHRSVVDQQRVPQGA